MSIAICVYVPEAIVLASDSRQMAQFERRPFFPENAEDGSEAEPERAAMPARFIAPATDTAEKVFNFFDRFGIAAVGEHVLEGQPLSFEIRNCIFNECNAESSIQDAANALKKYFSEIHPKSHAQFLVAGFEEGGGTPFPEVYSVHVRRPDVVQVNFHEGRLRYGCLWMGEGDTLTTLLATTEVRDHTGAAHKVQIPPIRFEGMTPLDARDFAIFSVTATKMMQRFQARPKTIGGRTQCLIIFPDGPVWADIPELERSVD
ncbi:hypothetical protein J7K50_02740 [bacterium]|nr:hypothetical protein [bacterium]